MDTFEQCADSVWPHCHIELQWESTSLTYSDIKIPPSKAAAMNM